MLMIMAPAPSRQTWSTRFRRRCIYLVEIFPNIDLISTYMYTYGIESTSKFSSPNQSTRFQPGFKAETWSKSDGWVRWTKFQLRNPDTFPQSRVYSKLTSEAGRWSVQILTHYRQNFVKMWSNFARPDVNNEAIYSHHFWANFILNCQFLNCVSYFICIWL